MYFVVNFLILNKYSFSYLKKEKEKMFIIDIVFAIGAIVISKPDRTYVARVTKIKEATGWPRKSSQ